MQMRTRPLSDKAEIRTGGIDEGCARYSVGRQTMRRIAEDANAVIRVGKRYLLNFERIDRYMDALSQ